MIRGNVRRRVLYYFLFGTEFEESDSTGPAGQPAPVASSGAAVSALTDHAERLS